MGMGPPGDTFPAGLNFNPATSTGTSSTALLLATLALNNTHSLLTMPNNIDDAVIEIEEGHPTLSEKEDFARGSGEVVPTDEDGISASSNDEKLPLSPTLDTKSEYN